MELGKIYQDLLTKSLFQITGKDGELGYKVYCVNGAWHATYDHEMGMLLNLRCGTWGYIARRSAPCKLVEKFEDIGY